MTTTEAAEAPEGPLSAAEQFRANVRQLRTERGWTPEKLGDRMRPEHSSPAQLVSMIESGRASSLGTVDDAARAFGLTPVEMISPLPCANCHGEPPEGYSCLFCEASTELVLVQGGAGTD